MFYEAWRVGFCLSSSRLVLWEVGRAGALRYGRFLDHASLAHQWPAPGNYRQRPANINQGNANIEVGMTDVVKI
jgi:hypothetical protein